MKAALFRRRRRENVGSGGSSSIAEFKFLVGDTVAAPTIGSAGTFSRGSVAYQINATGNWESKGTGVIRDAHYVNGTRTILIEAGINNVCQQSDNLSAWTGVNSPTLTSGQGDVYGGTSAYNVAATDGATITGVVITLAAITGNTVHGLTVCAKKGAAPPTNGSRILYRDTTAPANRLLATLTWSGSAPSVAMTTGKYIGALANANGWYTLFFQTIACTAANTHTLELDANGTATDTGDVYFGGVTAAHATNSGGSSVIPSAGSTVSRTSDTLSFPHGSTPQARTLYIKVLACGEGGYANQTYLSIGNSTDGQRISNNRGNLPVDGEIASLTNNTSASTANESTLGWVMGNTVEVRCAGDSGPKATVGVVVNGGAETTASGANSANAYSGSYGTANFQVAINGAGAAGTPMAILAIKSALGTQSMLAMQSA